MLVTLGGVLLFVGFAALITLLAPSYRIVLRREGGVQARIEQRLLWVIPVSVRLVDHVTGAKTTTEQPEPGEPMPGQNRAEVRPAETVGYLTLQGASGEARVMVSPADLSAMRRQVEEFLHAESPAELRLRAVANWKVSVLAPGIVAGIGGVIFLLFCFDVLRWGFGKKAETK